MWHIVKNNANTNDMMVFHKYNFNDCHNMLIRYVQCKLQKWKYGNYIYQHVRLQSRMHSFMIKTW